MNLISTITRTLHVVDRSLRKEFPEDFYKRCMYAAFGTTAILQDAGFGANIVGGDFLAFVVARSGQRAGLQGFGLGSDQPSHFWVEVDDTIVDVGPYYLPDGASFPAVSMPFVAWSPASVFPLYLRYRSNVQYDPRALLDSTPEIAKRLDAFVATCRARYAGQSGQPKLRSWLLTGGTALETAARAGDAWAQNAIRFANGIKEDQLPF
jgi:hypothetical protein